MLATLILVATVANLPLAVANVAPPSIGLYFNASQTQLPGLATGPAWHRQDPTPATRQARRK